MTVAILMAWIAIPFAFEICALLTSPRRADHPGVERAAARSAGGVGA